MIAQVQMYRHATSQAHHIPSCEYYRAIAPVAAYRWKYNHPVCRATHRRYVSASRYKYAPITSRLSSPSTYSNAAWRTSKGSGSRLQNTPTTTAITSAVSDNSRAEPIRPFCFRFSGWYKSRSRHHRALHPFAEFPPARTCFCFPVHEAIVSPACVLTEADSPDPTSQATGFLTAGNEKTASIRLA